MDEPLVSGVRCVVCSIVLLLPSGQLPICPNHLAEMSDWAKENAVYCHFFHRGVPLLRYNDNGETHNGYGEPYNGYG